MRRNIVSAAPNVVPVPRDCRPAEDGDGKAVSPPPKGRRKPCDDEVTKAVLKVGSLITSVTRALAALNGLLSPGHPLAALIRACCTQGYGLQQTFNLHRELEPLAERRDDFNVQLPFSNDSDDGQP